MRGAAQALHFAREELLFLPSQVLFLSPIALLQGVKGWGSNITSFSFILFGICIAQSLSLSLFLCKLTRFQKKNTYSVTFSPIHFIGMTPFGEFSRSYDWWVSV